VSVRCILIRLNKLFFRALSKYSSGKDASPPRKRLGRTSVSIVAIYSVFVD